MKFFKNLSKMQYFAIALLVGLNGLLGYLFYDSYRTNIQDRELIKQTKIENIDLSQDLEITKGKNEKLQKEIDALKSKVKKASFKKKYSKKKKLYSAGKSSKHKKYYKRKVNYKKLYFELREKCYGKKHKKSYKYRRR